MRSKPTAFLAVVVALAAVTVVLQVQRWIAVSEAAIGTSGRPVVLVLSKVHEGALPADRRQRFAERLSDASGLRIEARVASSAPSAIDAFGGRNADVGLLPLLEYLLARQEYAVKARLQVLRAGGAAEYASEIVVRDESPVRSLRELEGRTVALVDRYSASGFLLPAALLADSGVAPRFEFTGTHEEALRHVIEGRAAAAGTLRGAGAKDNRLRVLAETRAVRSEPIFFRDGFDDAKIERIVSGFESIASTPDGRSLLSELAGIEGVRRTTDAEYAPVHESVLATGKRLRQLVPEGHLVNRPDPILVP